MVYAGLVGMVISLLAEEPVSTLFVVQIEVNDCEKRLRLNKKKGDTFFKVWHASFLSKD